MIVYVDLSDRFNSWCDGTCYYFGNFLLYLFCNVFNHFWANFLGRFGHWCCYYYLPKVVVHHNMDFIVDWAHIMVQTWGSLINA